MDYRIETAPHALDTRKERRHLLRVFHVQRHQDGRLNGFGQRRHVRVSVVVQVGHGDLCAQFMERPGTAPRNRIGIGHAGHQHTGAGKRRIGYVDHGGSSWTKPDAVRKPQLRGRVARGAALRLPVARAACGLPFPAWLRADAVSAASTGATASAASGG